MARVYGYLRVSTEHQDLQRQKVLVKKYCEDNELNLIGYIWKIQCKLPPKTKRFCPLVLK